MNIKNFLLIVCCFLPSVCCAVGLDTKIAWEPQAINIAVMNFCMPELEDDTKLHFYPEGDTEPFASLGNVSAIIVDWNKGGQLQSKNLTFIPKCSAFIDSYVAQIEKNPKVSLNQIISMCLDTIEDKLICENIVLLLINVQGTDSFDIMQWKNEKAFNADELTKLEQKISNNINANHTICSDDNRFCTTYSLFVDKHKLNDIYLHKSSDITGLDVIYTPENNQIIGVCEGIERDWVFELQLAHGHRARCITTKTGYELYEFDIKDITDESIDFTYMDYGELTELEKEYLERTKNKIQTLEQYITKTANVDTNRALNNNMGSVAFGLTLCEKDNSTPNTTLDCKVQVLKNGYKQTMQNLQELSFEKAEKNLDKYKSMLYNYSLESITLRYQTELLLTNCKN